MSSTEFEPEPEACVASETVVHDTAAEGAHERHGDDDEEETAATTSVEGDDDGDGDGARGDPRQQPDGFLFLPYGMWIHVMRHLSVADVCALSATCLCMWDLQRREATWLDLMARYGVPPPLDDLTRGAASFALLRRHFVRLTSPLAPFRANPSEELMDGGPIFWNTDTPVGHPMHLDASCAAFVPSVRRHATGQAGCDGAVQDAFLLLTNGINAKLVAMDKPHPDSRRLCRFLPLPRPQAAAGDTGFTTLATDGTYVVRGWANTALQVYRLVLEDSSHASWSLVYGQKRLPKPLRDAATAAESDRFIAAAQAAVMRDPRKVKKKAGKKSSSTDLLTPSSSSSSSSSSTTKQRPTSTNPISPVSLRRAQSLGDSLVLQGGARSASISVNPVFGQTLRSASSVPATEDTWKPKLRATLLDRDVAWFLYECIVDAPNAYDRRRSTKLSRTKSDGSGLVLNRSFTVGRSNTLRRPPTLAVQALQTPPRGIVRYFRAFVVRQPLKPRKPAPSPSPSASSPSREPDPDYEGPANALQPTLVTMAHPCMQVAGAAYSVVMGGKGHLWCLTCVQQPVEGGSVTDALGDYEMTVYHRDTGALMHRCRLSHFCARPRMVATCWPYALVEHWNLVCTKERPDFGLMHTVFRCLPDNHVAEGITFPWLFDTARMDEHYIVGTWSSTVRSPYGPPGHSVPCGELVYVSGGRRQIWVRQWKDTWWRACVLGRRHTAMLMGVPELPSVPANLWIHHFHAQPGAGDAAATAAAVAGPTGSSGGGASTATAAATKRAQSTGRMGVVDTGGAGPAYDGDASANATGLTASQLVALELYGAEDTSGTSPLTTASGAQSGSPSSASPTSASSSSAATSSSTYRSRRKSVFGRSLRVRKRTTTSQSGEKRGLSSIFGRSRSSTTLADTKGKRMTKE